MTDMQKFQAVVRTWLYENGREAARPFLRSWYAHDTSVQAQFPNAECFAGYMMAVADGRCRLSERDIATFPVPSEAVLRAVRAGAADPMAQFETAARLAYRSDAGIRSDYLSEDAYLAAKRHEARKAGVAGLRPGSRTEQDAAGWRTR